MKKYKNITQVQFQRETDARYGRVMVNGYKVTEDFIKRLGLVGELDGHTGCVNCLEWSSDGRLLATGSDDLHICIWDAFRKKKLASFPTTHHGNVFSVKFIPNTGNVHIASGAGDSSVRVHDTTSQECFNVCTCHKARVKRLVMDPITPPLFWSAGEDGLILQHDLRVSHTCTSGTTKPRNILLDLKSYIGGKGEAKCVAINPVRSELLAVGANDPYIRLYDRRMIKLQFQENENGSLSTDSSEIPRGAVQYFVPGHIPSKMSDYVRKYRSLASTYVEFSPDGTELLTNMGGEQIYLFPLQSDLREDCTTFTIPRLSSAEGESPKRQTANGYANGFRKESVEVFNDVVPRAERRASKPPLPGIVEQIKAQANEAFDSRKYARAIQLYNEALVIYPNSAILLANRAAALLKRSWDGDVYVALRDCISALKIDGGHHKAYLRLCRCLFELSRIDEAFTKYNDFKQEFPEYSSTAASKRLEEDLSKAIKKRESSPSVSDGSDHSLFSNSSSSSAQSSATTTPTPTRLTRNYFFRFSAAGSPDNSNSGQDSDAPMSSNDETPRVRSSSEAEDSAADGEGATPEKTGKKTAKLDVDETEFRSKAVDFLERYCGHCNTTTDIKEANFFGNYIVAGSDDGSFFIWDRKTTNIVKILRGDESIVNCLQPHPSTCLLATSGIEQIVRLWAPLPEYDEKTPNDRAITEWNDVASKNQTRMNSNPFEVILMNMGYRLRPDEDPSDDEGTPRPPSNTNANVRAGVQCTQS